MNNLYEKEHPSYYFGSMITVVMTFFLGVSTIVRGQREREYFPQITSPITRLTNSLNDSIDIHEADIKYLSIKNYPQTFELFIGKESGYFNPKLDQIDKLRVGDTITIYFEIQKTNRENINRLVQFIDKDKQPYFIRSNSDAYIGCTAIGFSALMMVAILIYRKKEN